MADLAFSLDSSSGDSFDTGLSDSAVDYSGDLTDPSISDTVGSDPSLTGGGLDFNTDNFASAPDLSLLDQQTIAGVTDPTPAGSLDTGNLDTNGAGSADSADVGAGSPTSSIDWNTALSTFGKFGASLAGVITGNPVATVNGQPIGARGSIAYDQNGRPIINRPPGVFSMSGTHLTVIVAVLGGLAAYLAFVSLKK